MQPTRLPRPQDSPGKNTGVGSHFLLQCMKVKSESEVVQLCPTLSDPMDCSPPGYSVHGIFQARALEWGAIAFSIQRTSIPLRRNTRKLVLFLAAFLSLSLSFFVSLNVFNSLCEDTERRWSSTIQEERWHQIPTLIHLDLELPASRKVRKKFPLLKPYSLWYFLMAFQAD